MEIDEEKFDKTTDTLILNSSLQVRLYHFLLFSKLNAYAFLRDSKDIAVSCFKQMKEVHQNNQMAFLLQVSQKPQRPKEIVIDNVTYPQDLFGYYKVRYGVLNELEST